MQKKNSITMASRFEIVAQQYIQELKEKSENEKSKEKHRVLEERF